MLCVWDLLHHDDKSFPFLVKCAEAVKVCKSKAKFLKLAAWQGASGVEKMQDSSCCALHQTAEAASHMHLSVTANILMQVRR